MKNIRVVFFGVIFPLILAPANAMDNHSLEEKYYAASVQDAELYLRGKVLKSLERHEMQLAKCEKTKEKTAPPSLDKQTLGKLGFGKKELLSALLYLSQLNEAKCSAAERNQFAFNYVTYVIFLKQNNIDASTVKFLPFKKDELKLELDSAQSIIELTEFTFGTIPFLGSISVDLNYLNMPAEKRSYLEDQIGDKMFMPIRLYKNYYE